MATVIRGKATFSISKKGIETIKHFEGMRLKAYLDDALVPTIGWGTTRYEKGDLVKLGDVITRERADELLKFEADAKAYGIGEALHGVVLNQNQKDSLICLAYNIGVGAFLGSTVLRLVKKNPDDPAIRDAFGMWVKITVNKKKITSNGLVSRRKEEADLYFS